MTLTDPYPVTPLVEPPDTSVSLPGSKSITNRALVCAALAEGTSLLRGALFADDTEAMVSVLDGLGITTRIDRAAATIGVDATGYAFSPTVVNIDVGQTVCWSWTDASMPHNVREVDGFKSTTYVEGGVTSGAAAATVAFSHTFTEDTTFYYACEPHIGLNMFGEVVVGDGGATTETTDDADDESEDTPGFMLVPTLVAVIGALALMGRQSRNE